MNGQLVIVIAWLVLQELEEKAKSKGGTWRYPGADLAAFPPFGSVEDRVDTNASCTL